MYQPNMEKLVGVSPEILYGKPCMTKTNKNECQLKDHTSSTKSRKDYSVDYQFANMVHRVSHDMGNAQHGLLILQN